MSLIYYVKDRSPVLQKTTCSLRPLNPLQQSWIDKFGSPVGCDPFEDDFYINRMHVVYPEDHRTPPVQKEHDGTLSLNARRKLKSAIRWLVACSETKKVYEKKLKRVVPWKINMITLTFKTNMQDDKLARKLLSMWLEVAKYRWSVVHYVWKAEPQSRGAIHFHIATNRYCPWREVQYTWNRLLSKHGLSQPYSNSTDVHACEGVNDLESYLTDYMMNESKHEGRRKITGKLWGCSHGLSRAGKLYLELGSHSANEYVQEFSPWSLERSLLEEGKPVPAFLQNVNIFLHAKLPPLPMAIYQNEIRYLKEMELEEKRLF